MTTAHSPTGQLFTHVYLDRDAPIQDSELFRRRLGGYVQSTLYKDHSKLTTYVKTESGLTVNVTAGQGWLFHAFEDFFVTTPIQYILNVITLIHRFLWDNHKTFSKHGNNWIYVCPQADEWRQFVGRVFREENLGYTLDDQCGVHYLVDQEFERNRVSLLRGLESSRYSGVRAAFETAHRYLDVEPRDPKAAVRSMFESLEILTKLMVETKNLNKWVVENKLKQLAQSVYASDETAMATISSTFDGFAQWVDGLHNYRHGQGKPEPVAPPVGFAIYVVSSGAAFLRWLVEIDHTLRSRSNPPLQPTPGSEQG